MPWFLGERRGPQWKQGWTAQTLNSLSLPPAPLVAIFAIVLLFLSLSSSSSRKEYRERIERVEVGLRLLLVLVPLMLVLAAKWMVVEGRLVLPARVLRVEQEGMDRGGSSPWGMAALVVLLLVMVSFHSSFESQWFRPLWRRL